VNRPAKKDRKALWIGYADTLEVELVQAELPYDPTGRSLEELEAALHAARELVSRLKIAVRQAGGRP